MTARQPGKGRVTVNSWRGLGQITTSERGPGEDDHGTKGGEGWGGAGSTGA